MPPNPEGNARLTTVLRACQNVATIGTLVLFQLLHLQVCVWVFTSINVSLKIIPDVLGLPFFSGSALFFLAFLASSSPMAVVIGLAWVLKERGQPRRYWVGLAGFMSLYYVINLILLSYRIHRGFPFDFYLLWYNLTDAIETIRALSEYFDLLVLLLVLVGILQFRGLLTIIEGSYVSKQPIARRFLVCASLACVGSHGIFGNETIQSVLPLFARSSEAKSLYEKYYRESLAMSKKTALARVPSQATENLFIVQLESVNSQLVNQTVTPRWLQLAADNGIMFPTIQGGAVITIRAQESILCSILPAVGLSTAASASLTEGLVCLPQLMKQLGYKTFFFHSFADIHFANTEPFMKRIGFDERHAADIMKPGDATLQWGYAEDIFYQRVFEYMEKFRGQKVFVYISVHSTNHYPFFDAEKIAAFPQWQQNLPYTKPASLRERIANTTYLQDRTFGDMYDRWFAPKYAENSHMVVLGDHSWPIGNREDAKSNDHGAFQDNFVTSMALLPARRTKNQFVLGRTVNGYFSQLDFMPTILELFGVVGLKGFGRSFLHEARGTPTDNQNPRCLVSVQPFSGSKITTLEYPVKHIYDIPQQQVTIYDLEKDPAEKAPVKISPIDTSELAKLRNCLSSLAAPL